MDIRECKTCGEEFDLDNSVHQIGFINVCGYCSDEDVEKTIGFMDTSGKSDSDIILIEKPTEGQKEFVKNLGNTSPTQPHTSLGLHSTGSDTKKDKLAAWERWADE